MPAVLRPSCARVLAAAAGAFVDGGQGGLPPVAESGCPERLERLAAHLPRDQVRLLHLGCAVMGGLSLLRFGRRFHRLDAERRRRVLSGLARSRVTALRRLHHVAGMLTRYAYFLGEETWAATGYDGPWLGRVPVEAAPPPDLGPVEGGP